MCLVKIGGLLVKIEGLSFGRIMEVLIGSHVSHISGLEIMDLIYLFNVVTGRVLVLTQRYMIMGMKLALTVMPWVLNLVMSH